MHQILIVGGGAGGLELATQLGDRLGRRRRAAVTLVDRNRTHVWKPLLHEVAAGSMDVHQHQLDYLAQARWHHFTFSLGALEGLDRTRREITVGAIRDDRGVQVIPPRTLRYDTLVIAIGSLANPFGVPGVAEHAFALDSAGEADHFNRRLVNAVLRANYHAEERNRELRVVIVGGGATGVELAAELHNTTRVLAAYGLENIDPERQVKLALLNADARILPGLPERISRATTEALEALGVQIHCSEQVVEVGAGEVRTKGGKAFPADLTVWAAGIKAADVLRDLDGLETNRLNQLVVLPTLQTTRDPGVFALGDCAACPWEGREGNVPPRAQAAHQQASHLVRTIERRLAGRRPPGATGTSGRSSRSATTAPSAR
jgi:NADH dehydrogenase